MDHSPNFYFLYSQTINQVVFLAMKELKNIYSLVKREGNSDSSIYSLDFESDTSPTTNSVQIQTLIHMNILDAKERWQVLFSAATACRRLASCLTCSSPNYGFCRIRPKNLLFLSSNLRAKPKRKKESIIGYKYSAFLL